MFYIITACSQPKQFFSLYKKKHICEPWCSGKVVPWWLVGHGFESGNKDQKMFRWLILCIFFSTGPTLMLVWEKCKKSTKHSWSSSDHPWSSLLQIYSHLLFKINDSSSLLQIYSHLLFKINDFGLIVVVFDLFSVVVFPNLYQ